MEHLNHGLTREDAAILRRVWPAFEYGRDDNIDYRAMLAYEVQKERVYRIFDDASEVTPNSILEQWGENQLRKFIETENGEPLA